MRKKLLLIPIGVLAVAAIWVLALTLTSGSVVAGSGSATFSKPDTDEGSYGNIRQTCPDESVVSHLPYQPDESWSFYSSELNPGYKVYDNFSGADGTDAIRFWGLRVYHDGVQWVECYEDPMAFTIEFLTDAAGQPGTVISTYSVSLTGTSTGLVYSGFTMYEWETNLVPPPALGSGPGWVSIQGTGDPDCWLLWANSATGDGISYQWTGSALELKDLDLAFCLIDYGEPCDWQPDDPHKMHFPQLPDEAGWDVNATAPVVLADDFECSETGWIKDFHFWGSWKHGIEGEILYFVLSLHEDIPADVNPDGYSKPGATLFEWEIYDFPVTPIDPPSMEGWYDPSTGEAIPDDHQAYFQYNICLDEPLWYPQDSGVIYWLNISAVLADPVQTQWGWKSTQDHWNDDAVWAFWGDLDWQEIYEPGGDLDPITNMWGVIVDQTGNVVQGYGEDAYDDGTSHMGWYFYPWYDWWNIWFYDHPFDPERYKTIHIEFDVFPFDAGPSWVEIAVNWSTDIWSIEQPPGDSAPPLPGVDEDLYIGRETVFFTEFLPGQPQPGFHSFDLEIPFPYNPEWVSVDIRGFNFQIDPGSITHECIAQQQSLDLSFVVTGEPPVPDSGACCYPEPTGSGDWLCLYTEESYCVNDLGGVWEGVGTQCLGMEACCLPVGDPLGDCVDADALCCVNELGGTPMGPGTACGATEACCFGTGACEDLDPLCCVQLGGVPQGPGTQCGALQACCLADDQCADMDPLCCVMLGGTPQGPGTQCVGALEACCLPNGNCTNLDPVCCLNLGGTPQGQGTNCTVPAACCIGDDCFMYDPLCCDDMGGTPSPWGAPACLGDDNENGINDACEMPEDLKWYQPPDLEPTGMDVRASDIVLLADDFLCDRTGPITEIHVWGSWLYDEMPNWDPMAVNFTLSIHADIPQGPFGWSIPGDLLWIRDFQAGEFEVIPYAFGLEEGWYDPELGFYLPLGDTQCWEYIFYLADDEFIQMGSESDPIVYWLDVFAVPDAQPEAYAFGWKTSREHWNDDAVWSFPPDPPPLDAWQELRYPIGHPFETQSIDLAFSIYGPAVCDVIIGDANNAGIPPIDIDDVVYLIAFIFSGGPAPIPYAAASGDANCSCVAPAVDIDDVVYLIAYIFSGGPPPCTCEEWVAACGALH
jgi:hypothetical protein